MKERLLAYARYWPQALYGLFYVVCLLVFASLTFPYGMLKEHVVSAFNAQDGGGGGQQELQIDDMGGYWLSGARMKGVRLLMAPTEPGQPPEKIEIDQASVRYGILASIFGGSDMSFDVLAFGGEGSGSFDTHGKDRTIELTLETINIGRVEPLVRLLGVPLKGELGGTIKLTTPEGKANKASGTVSLEIKNVVIGDGKAKIKGALPLPPIQVGTVTFVAEAKDGILKISKLVAGGKDLELQGEGRITLRDVATESLCDAQVRFRINDAYRNKDDMTRGLFGAPGSSTPALFELDPRVKQSKRADGFYGWSIRGPLSRADFIPLAGGGSFAGTPTPPQSP